MTPRPPDSGSWTSNNLIFVHGGEASTDGSTVGDDATHHDHTKATKTFSDEPSQFSRQCTDELFSFDTGIRALAPRLAAIASDPATCSQRPEFGHTS